MSKKGLLNPEYNRVRTSAALKGNDMWSNTIGIESQAGGNAVIESQIYAPGGASHVYVSGGGGGGRGGAMRASRQEKAANLISSSSLENTVKDQSELMALAKKQGIGSDVRGACKLCGGLGHLTKQCRNVLTGHTVASGTDVVHQQGLAAGQASRDVRVLGLLPDDLDIMSSDLSSSSESGSEKSEERREKRKRKRREEKKSKKHKKDKDHKKEKKSHKKSKRARSD